MKTWQFLYIMTKLDMIYSFFSEIYDVFVILAIIEGVLGTIFLIKEEFGENRK